MLTAPPLRSLRVPDVPDNPVSAEAMPAPSANIPPAKAAVCSPLLSQVCMVIPLLEVGLISSGGPRVQGARAWHRDGGTGRSCSR